ncbi:MAG: hypothetical protein A3D52_01305 [Candidatus Taylorbacteria bacterium RIFCSPHIGHO2_02_FULL_44_36]|uniref:Uncharacterized protein n=1 Tax=Candidatus Taylorbacteria bacterium RIFCSPLOWO2_12_FULL_44_15c TaxID=1802333 RepID=A0A1G2P7K2_9BACT|nr:MAG: hypothetical protein A3D52_01305 [Candidatus Taylorbacteria bacterium RIFCSPHIGHO2_02_FULL_44_36]OHA38896.1 MAG: hypothetical protein A3I97_01420 [Candidatus Taylorbacteria bacterium RIFCSPLOWO2_02_FULL_44_35]OHA43699.1 MAG: hypothetical protein A3G03_02505 [Candidatus Taylorbacteria bacterium RIFCSPLOWO2_12_FULL_44_15c]
MHQNKSKKNKMLILAAVVIVAAFIGYSLFLTDRTDNLALVSPQGVNQSQTARDLLVLFAELSAFDLNPAVLSNPAFVSLEDFSREIPSEPAGRTNPFVPI